MNIEVNFTTLDPSSAQQIWKSIQTGEVFGLAGKNSISIFDVNNLASLWQGNAIRFKNKNVVQKYSTIEDFQKGISLALLSQKTFVPLSHLVSYCDLKCIQLPRKLLS
jgi:hypothetical protein